MRTISSAFLDHLEYLVAEQVKKNLQDQGAQVSPSTEDRMNFEMVDELADFIFKKFMEERA